MKRLSVFLLSLFFLVGCKKKPFPTATQKPVIPAVSKADARKTPTRRPSPRILKNATAQVKKPRFKNPHFNLQCKGVKPAKGRVQLRLQRILKKVGFRALTDIAFAPGYPELVFITEKLTGRVHYWKLGTSRPIRRLLDIWKLISRGSEQGLLGLAFHPQFKKNHLFYVYYTDKKGTVRVVEYKSQKGILKAIPSSRRLLLSVPQPESNHNGGALRFGPDGYLYIGTGDGGSGGDPHGKYGNGQNTSNLLGKILRIDVNKRENGKPYGIPAGNPFASKKGGRKEIYHWGLRNPWRISFDRKTGALWMGDVGQNRVEEIDVSPYRMGGLNYGWRCKEGRWIYRKDKPCRSKKLIDPVIHLPQNLLRSKGINYCSMMVGHTYRGCKMPGYHGTHFYGDFCAPHLRWFQWDGKVATKDSVVPGVKIRLLTSWAADHQGELYIVTLRGEIYKLVPR